jgi:hypothetical protein
MQCSVKDDLAFHSEHDFFDFRSQMVEMILWPTRKHDFRQYFVFHGFFSLG